MFISTWPNAWWKQRKREERCTRSIKDGMKTRKLCKSTAKKGKERRKEVKNKKSFASRMCLELDRKIKRRWGHFLSPSFDLFAISSSISFNKFLRRAFFSSLSSLHVSANSSKEDGSEIPGQTDCHWLEAGLPLCQPSCWQKVKSQSHKLAER